MKYLFFDIESSNCFNGISKMCEFGYCITDENFKILSSDDIPMSPGKGRQNRFHLRDVEGKKDITLAYDEEYYYSCHEFPWFYDRIKEIMESPDTLCFGWASSNDILALDSSCTRYGKQPLNYNCLDVQKIAIDYRNIKGSIGLAKACREIVGPNSLIAIEEHLARDDAKMTMMILDAICQLRNIESKHLINEYKSLVVNSIEYINKLNSKKANQQEIKQRHIEYDKNAKEYETLLNDNRYFGKRYCFSDKLIKKWDNLIQLIQKVHEIGGILTLSPSKADIFVCFDNEDMMELKEKFTSDQFTNLNYILHVDLLLKRN